MPPLFEAEGPRQVPPGGLRKIYSVVIHVIYLNDPKNIWEINRIILMFLFLLQVLILQASYILSRGVKLIFTGGHVSLVVAFKGLNIILGLYKCINYSLTRGKELGTAAGWKQGAGQDKTRWRAGFGLLALYLPPVV